MKACGWSSCPAAAVEKRPAAKEAAQSVATDAQPAASAQSKQTAPAAEQDPAAKVEEAAAAAPTEEASDAAKPERLILHTIEKSEIEKEVGLAAVLLDWPGFRV